MSTAPSYPRPHHEVEVEDVVPTRGNGSARSTLQVLVSQTHLQKTNDVVEISLRWGIFNNSLLSQVVIYEIRFLEGGDRECRTAGVNRKTIYYSTI